MPLFPREQCRDRSRFPVLLPASSVARTPGAPDPTHGRRHCRRISDSRRRRRQSVGLFRSGCAPPAPSTRAHSYTICFYCPADFLSLPAIFRRLPLPGGAAGIRGTRDPNSDRGFTFAMGRGGEIMCPRNPRQDFRSTRCNDHRHGRNLEITSIRFCKHRTVSPIFEMKTGRRTWRLIPNTSIRSTNRFAHTNNPLTSIA